MSSESTKLYSASSVFKSLADKGDVTFLFGDDKKVNAITDVLASVSPVFKSMFSGDLVESSHVRVVDISYDVFSSMIKLIHGYEIDELDSGVLVDTLIAVDKYLIDSLKSDICNYLQENLNDSIALTIFDRMIELNQIGLFRLIERVEKYIFFRCTTILNDELHIHISESALMSILNVKRLDVSEMDVINGISKWIDNKLEREGLQVDRFNKQQAFVPFKPLVRFRDLNVIEFMKGKTVLDDLLTCEEAYNILGHSLDETVQLNIEYKGDRNIETWVYCDAETITLHLNVAEELEAYLRVNTKAFVKSIRTNLPAEVKNLKFRIFGFQNGRQQEIKDLTITNSLVANKWKIEFPHELEMIPGACHRIIFEFTNTSITSTYKMFQMSNDNGHFKHKHPDPQNIQFSLLSCGHAYHCIDRIYFRYDNHDN